MWIYILTHTYLHILCIYIIYIFEDACVSSRTHILNIGGFSANWGNLRVFFICLYLLIVQKWMSVCHNLANLKAQQRRFLAVCICPHMYEYIVHGYKHCVCAGGVMRNFSHKRISCPALSAELLMQRSNWEAGDFGATVCHHVGSGPSLIGTHK